MERKTAKLIVTILLVMAASCLAYLLTGCTQTYKVIHSGTVTIYTQPIPEPQNQWSTDPGWPIDPGFYQEFPVDIEGPMIIGSAEPGVIITYDYDSTAILFDIIDDPVPAELKACKHEFVTVFVIGTTVSCKCNNCGSALDDGCE